MRILLVIQELGFGGAERVVLALRDGAERDGHDVDVVAAPDLPLVERRPTRLPRAVRSLARRLRRSRPDIVHCHNPTMALVGSLATWRGRRSPALATMHGVPVEDYPRAARILRYAALPTVACGPGVARALRDAGFQVSRTIVNGVSAAPEPASRAGLHDAWDLPERFALAVSVGRLVEQKNHELGIRAIGGVPDAALVIVGVGPLRGELEQEAARTGVADRVVFAGSRPDARAIIGAADVLVLPSHWEGLPLVALEALAAGTPVVATDVLGIRDLLTDGQDALLVPPGDAAALGSALRRVLEEPALAASLRIAGLSLAAEHSEDRMVRSYLDLYRELAR